MSKSEILVLLAGNHAGVLSRNHIKTSEISKKNQKSSIILPFPGMSEKQALDKHSAYISMLSSLQKHATTLFIHCFTNI